MVDRRTGGVAGGRDRAVAAVSAANGTGAVLGPNLRFQRAGGRMHVGQR